MPSEEPRTVALAPVREMAAATRAMVVVTCAAGTLGTWASWHRYQVAVDYVAGEPGVGLAKYVSAYNTNANVGVLWVLAWLTTGVMFLTWSWRARDNAGRLSTLPHRLSRGWVIGGWLVPAFPMVVLEDVWRTSRPGVPCTGHARELPKAWLVRSWWYAALASSLAWVWLSVAQQSEPTIAALLDVASITTVLSILQIVTAALVTAVIRQITQWQTPRGSMP
jgi:hypothetical protein